MSKPSQPTLNEGIYSTEENIPLKSIHNCLSYTVLLTHEQMDRNELARSITEPYWCQ